MPTLTITANGRHGLPRLDYAALRSGSLSLTVSPSATLGGGTLALQYTTDGTVWSTVDGSSALTAGQEVVAAPLGEFALNLSGATTPNIPVNYKVIRSSGDASQVAGLDAAIAAALATEDGVTAVANALATDEGAAAVAAALQIVTVTGADASGTDAGGVNPAAFDAAVAAIPAAGGVLLIPPGEYFFDVYNTNTGSPTREACLKLDGRRNIFVIADGVKFTVKGGFNRSASTVSTIIGLLIRECEGIIVSGLEVNGNKETITKGAVNENFYGHGVAIVGGKSITLQGVYAHDCTTDGFYIAYGNIVGGVYPVARNISYQNCRSVANARQALSITGARGVTAINSTFSFTGKTSAGAASAYGYHSPVAGCDLEPNRDVTSSPNPADQNQGDIVFIGCTFEGNLGNQFVAANPNQQDTVTCLSCAFIPWEGDNANPILGACKGMVFEQCTYDFHSHAGTNEAFAINPLWYSTGEGASFAIVGGKLIHKKTGISVTNETYGRCTIDGLSVEWKPDSSAVSGTNAAINIASKLVEIDRMTLFLSATGYASNATRAVIGAGFVRELFVYTDLAAGAGTDHFGVDLSGRNARGVFNARFRGAQVGTTDTVRPTVNGTTFDSNNLYSIPPASLGGRGLRGVTSPGDASVTLVVNASTIDQIWNVPLTASRTFTLSTSGVFAGAEFYIERTTAATGNFLLKDAGTLCGIGPGECARYKYNGSAWVLAYWGFISGNPVVGADVGNAAKTLTIGITERVQIWNTALTADRAVTLSTTGAKNGDWFEIIRTAAATGAFNLNVGSGPLKAQPVGSRGLYRFDGSAWALHAYALL